MSLDLVFTSGLVYRRDKTVGGIQSFCELRPKVWKRIQINKYRVIKSRYKYLFRCSSKKCRIGHFYGFTTKGKKIHYDNNCLERPFFFTSRKTGYFL